MNGRHEKHRRKKEGRCHQRQQTGAAVATAFVVEFAEVQSNSTWFTAAAVLTKVLIINDDEIGSSQDLCNITSSKYASRMKANGTAAAASAIRVYSHNKIVIEDHTFRVMCKPRRCDELADSTLTLSQLTDPTLTAKWRTGSNSSHESIRKQTRVSSKVVPTAAADDRVPTGGIAANNVATTTVTTSSSFSSDTVPATNHLPTVVAKAENIKGGTTPSQHRLVTDLLFHHLHPGSPVNPPNRGGLSRIRNTIKDFAGLTRDERIAKILSWILDANRKRTDAGEFSSLIRLDLVEKIRELDRDIAIIPIAAPFDIYGGQINYENLWYYQRYGRTPSLRLFVMQRYGIIYKPYALFDPSDGYIYRPTMIHQVSIEVINLNSYQNYYTNFEVIRFPYRPGSTILGTDVTRVRQQARAAAAAQHAELLSRLRKESGGSGTFGGGSMHSTIRRSSAYYVKALVKLWKKTPPKGKAGLAISTAAIGIGGSAATLALWG